MVKVNPIKINSLAPEGSFSYPRKAVVSTQSTGVRDNIINELLSTEQSYVRELCVLIKVFKREMTEKARCGKIEMSQEEVDRLFGYSDTILSVNTQMCERMRAKLSNWNHSTSTISDVLNDLAPFLKMYKDYSVTISSSVKHITNIDPKQQPLLFAYFEKKRNDRVCRGLDFGTFLTTPIKRIPRYLLLLKELRKHTKDPNHPEIKFLDAAERSLGQVADDINKAIIMNEKRLQVVEIAQKLVFKIPVDKDFDLVCPGRELITQLSCTHKKKKACLYLFNDLLLLAQKDKVVWSVKAENLEAENVLDQHSKNMNVIEMRCTSTSTTASIIANDAKEIPTFLDSIAQVRSYQLKLKNDRSSAHNRQFLEIQHMLEKEKEGLHPK
eukprot:TRINITY_DN6767_c0_g1_i3.p1 TRINITY_DN6767_c0_g1~~TRINITY_DN6767_c0_g1_i3.p1  ORF type:complete len:383 (+),score=107.07 TRINITY_DN6767_c0_g1_i3:222-1370(+)